MIFAGKNNSKNRRHEIQCQSEKILLLDFFIYLVKIELQQTVNDWFRIKENRKKSVLQMRKMSSKMD